MIPFTSHPYFGEAQFRIIHAYVGRGTNHSIGQSHDYSQKGADWSKENQIIPYTRKGGKRTSKGEHNLSSAQVRIVPTDVGRGTNHSTGLSYDYSQKGTDWNNEKQIIPYSRKGGKKNSKGEHNLSSVHGVEGAMVPHHKPLNSTKKKELGRVYLDPRNITVWNLLIQNESNFGKEKVDTNTEKWWENERKVFRGRIGAFNALLHPILGKVYFMKCICYLGRRTEIS